MSGNVMVDEPDYIGDELRPDGQVGKRGVDFPAPHWGYYYFERRPRPWVRPLDFFKAFLHTKLAGEAFRWFAGYGWMVGYCGVTVDRAMRFSSHAERSKWFPNMDEAGVYMWELIDGGRPMFTSEATALWERPAIKSIIPLHNIKMNERRGRLTPRPVRFRNVTPSVERAVDRCFLTLMGFQFVAIVVLSLLLIY